MIRIQSYEPRYREGVRELIVPIQKDEFGIEITYDQQTDLHDIGAHYQKGAGNFWVALNEADRVVGSVALLDIGNAQGALRKMFVAPDYRGHPHRTAQRLLTVLLDHAQHQAITAIYLGTTDKFLAAHRFYEKNGFQKIALEMLPESFPRMAVDTIFYSYAMRPAP